MDHASLLWVQIPVKDLERATAFYENVFEYTFFFENLNGMPHAVFKENDTGIKPVNGALVEVDKDMHFGLGPILFLDATGRFDEFLERIVEWGGEILKGKTLIKKTLDSGLSEIPRTYVDDKSGYFAHFLDCEGNRLGLYGSY